jgi:hypothetical protein
LSYIKIPVAASAQDALATEGDSHGHAHGRDRRSGSDSRFGGWLLRNEAAEKLMWPPKLHKQIKSRH